jgi:hypothetical protein
MIRKGLIGLILFFYLAGTTGLVVTIHHCMNQFSSLSFFHHQDHDDGNCNRCGMDMNENKCCSDYQFSYKIQDAHQSTSLSVLMKTEMPLVSRLESVEVAAIKNELVWYSQIHISPDIQTNKRYRDFCVFRI